MNNLQSQLLEQILPLVPFDGWSDYALTQAANRAGLNAQDIKRAFPDGINDCIDCFFASNDDALLKDFPEAELAKMRVPDRIETLILAKLQGFTPYREAVRRAVSVRALPWNAPRALKSLYRSIDLMWRLAGDKAIDFSFYTKRATLAAVYGSTLVYWLGDQSESMVNTREFLKRRLADVAAFGKVKKEFTGKFHKAS